MENDEDYLKCLKENPLLSWHPEFMTSPACKNRDFLFVDSEQKIDNNQINIQEVSPNNVNNLN